MPLRWLSQRGLVFIQATAAGALEGRPQQRVKALAKPTSQPEDRNEMLRPCLYPSLQSEAAADLRLTRPASAEDARRATEVWEATVAAAVRAEEEALVALSRSDRGLFLYQLSNTELQLIMQFLRFHDLLRLIRCNRRLRAAGSQPFAWIHAPVPWHMR